MSDSAKVHNTKLSVNVNKIATLRNARGGSIPDVLLAAERIEGFGAEGITVHPRPDARHITYSDVRGLKNIVNTEFNIEGYPNQKFIELVLEVNPDQVTLVPDPPDALTSSFGWDCLENKNLLKDIVYNFKENNIRVSLFISPSIKNLEHLCDILPDRVELYTFDYAKNFNQDPEIAIKDYLEVVRFLNKITPTIELNAGHDLNLQNLSFFLQKIKAIKEVSIGHALICDTFEYGLKNTIEKYLSITKS